VSELIKNRSYSVLLSLTVQLQPLPRYLLPYVPRANLQSRLKRRRLPELCYELYGCVSSTNHNSWHCNEVRCQPHGPTATCSCTMPSSPIAEFFLLEFVRHPGQWVEREENYGNK
jgi:hypothetical protein